MGQFEPRSSLGPRSSLFCHICQCDHFFRPLVNVVYFSTFGQFFLMGQKFILQWGTRPNLSPLGQFEAPLLTRRFWVKLDESYGMYRAVRRSKLVEGPSLMDLKSLGRPGRGPVLNFGKTGGAAAPPATPVCTGLEVNKQICS